MEQGNVVPVVSKLLVSKPKVVFFEPDARPFIAMVQISSDRVAAALGFSPEKMEKISVKRRAKVLQQSNLQSIHWADLFLDGIEDALSGREKVFTYGNLTIKQMEDGTVIVEGQVYLVPNVHLDSSWKRTLRSVLEPLPPEKEVSNEIRSAYFREKFVEVSGEDASIPLVMGDAIELKLMPKEVPEGTKPRFLQLTLIMDDECKESLRVCLLGKKVGELLSTPSELFNPGSAESKADMTMLLSKKFVPSADKKDVLLNDAFKSGITSKLIELRKATLDSRFQQALLSLGQDPLPRCIVERLGKLQPVGLSAQQLAAAVVARSVAQRFIAEGKSKYSISSEELQVRADQVGHCSTEQLVVLELLLYEEKVRRLIKESPDDLVQEKLPHVQAAVRNDVKESEVLPAPTA